jgi:GNAT superfamily N-acetyltransferase
MNTFDGLPFRSFAGKSDYAKMAKLLQTISIADHADFWVTPEDIERDYQHLINSNPETDMYMLENFQGDLAAYTRVGWDVDDEGRQIFSFPFNIHPDWRTPQLNRHLLLWVEERCTEIVKTTAQEAIPVLRVFLRNIEKDHILQAALDAEHFQPVRFMNRMARDLSEPIQISSLPAGLEIRPVPETHYRTMLSVLDEAFRDHWGHSPIPDNAFEQWSSSPQFNPALWQVAWDGDEIAAGILNFIDAEANVQLNVKRGWTDPIFTRRPWRKRGLAHTLLLRSLEMFKKMGMTEAMLGVDTQNPNGAFDLYEKCGFKSVMRSVVYEKVLTAN